MADPVIVPEQQHPRTPAAEQALVLFEAAGLVGIEQRIAGLAQFVAARRPA